MSAHSGRNGRFNFRVECWNHHSWVCGVRNFRFMLENVFDARGLSCAGFAADSTEIEDEAESDGG